MSAPRSRGLRGALAATVGRDLDVADALAHLVTDCAEATGAAAVALLASDGDGDLALLAATSHRAEELEMLQAQRVQGPCVDTMRTGHPVSCDDRDEIVRRWGEVGDALLAAGFVRVEAFPMHYRGGTVGGLNMFWSAAGPGEPELDRGLAQAYADMATIVVAQAALRLDAVRHRVHEAMEARQAVEQAKGVVAYVENVGLGEAYDLLLQHADATDDGLTRFAQEVVRRRGLP